MMRHLLILCVFIFGSVAAFVPPAQAGLLEFFFPMLRDNSPEPIETLKAPFANEDAVFEGLDASGNRENSAPLHLKHRTNDKLTEWIMHTVPSFIVYKADDYRTTYSEKITNFSSTGKKEYIQFLRDANILKTLETGAYDVSGFIKDYPVIINERAVGNRYRWVYRTTIMVTYLKAGLNSYSTGGLDNSTILDTGDAISQEWEVTFQIGRSREAVNDAGVFFETWSARKL